MLLTTITNLFVKEKPRGVNLKLKFIKFKPVASIETHKNVTHDQFSLFEDFQSQRYSPHM